MSKHTGGVSQAHRDALYRAAVAWRASRPHEALEIVQAAGLGQYWPEIEAGFLADSRARYLRAIGHYSTTT